MPKSRSLIVPLSVTRMFEGLEVAMHDQVLMGVLHRLGHDLEESYPRRHVESVLVAVDVEAPPFDQLHGRERPSVLGDAAVEELRDIRVTERGDDLALAQKPLAGLAVSVPGRMTLTATCWSKWPSARSAR